MTMTIRMTTTIVTGMGMIMDIIITPTRTPIIRTDRAA